MLSLRPPWVLIPHTTRKCCPLSRTSRISLRSWVKVIPWKLGHCLRPGGGGGGSSVHFIQHDCTLLPSIPIHPPPHPFWPTIFAAKRSKCNGNNSLKRGKIVAKFGRGYQRGCSEEGGRCHVLFYSFKSDLNPAGQSTLPERGSCNHILAYKEALSINYLYNYSLDPGAEYLKGFLK